MYEGEDPQAANNRLLGHFVLTGLTPKSVGENVITVEFIVDSKNALVRHTTFPTGFSLLTRLFGQEI